jgi:hypothetical protein
MSFISDALRQNISHIGYHVSCALKAKYPERAVLEGQVQSFNATDFAAAGHCSLAPSARAQEQVLTYWTGEGLTGNPENAVYDVTWAGESLEVVLITFSPGSATYFWIVARNQDVAEAFFAAVCRWCTEIRSEILVYAGGQFYKDEALYREIRAASLDKIVLGDGLKDEIVADLRQFFESKSVYDEYNIPWKRGLLFLGPPGNGKTFTIKALTASLGYPCIYVKSFDLPMNAYPQAGINAVFARARQSTPCILVLEDLDALVGDHNRSFFLNELDGFAANAGIVTLATSNHPERLDPAILERPSRFDRKYHFDLPAHAQRRAYAVLWNAMLAQKLALEDRIIDEIAEKTEGFSYAYIKELYLSSMMRWASNGGGEPFGELLLGQIDALRAQMSSMDAEVPMAGGGDEIPPQVLQMMAMRGFGNPYRHRYQSRIQVITGKGD